MAEIDGLAPCRACGAPCSVQTFEGPHIQGTATVWLCSNHRHLGGACPSDTAYLTEAAWNTEWQPIETAPRDGDFIWLGKPGFIRLGYWEHGEWMDLNGPLTIEPTSWMRPVQPEPPQP